MLQENRWWSTSGPWAVVSDCFTAQGCWFRPGECSETILQLRDSSYNGTTVWPFVEVWLFFLFCFFNSTNSCSGHCEDLAIKYSPCRQTQNTWMNYLYLALLCTIQMDIKNICSKSSLHLFRYLVSLSFVTWFPGKDHEAHRTQTSDDTMVSFPGLSSQRHQQG